MSRHLTIRHTTEYSYREPVGFGVHRMMFRPRDSHTLRLLNTNLTIYPQPERIRWTYDVFGNSVAHAEFGKRTSNKLIFQSEIDILHYETMQPTQLLLESAERFPFSYTDDEKPDLFPVMAPQLDNHSDVVGEWARVCRDNCQRQNLGDPSRHDGRVAQHHHLQEAIRTGYTGAR